MDLLQYDAIGAREFTPAAPHRNPDAEEVAGQTENPPHSISSSTFTVGQTCKKACNSDDESSPSHNISSLFTSVLTVMRQKGFDLQESAIRFSSSSGQKIMAIRRFLELKPLTLRVEPFNSAENFALFEL